MLSQSFLVISICNFCFHFWCEIIGFVCRFSKANFKISSLLYDLKNIYLNLIFVQVYLHSYFSVCFPTNWY